MAVGSNRFIDPSSITDLEEGIFPSRNMNFTALLINLIFGIKSFLSEDGVVYGIANFTMLILLHCLLSATPERFPVWKIHRRLNG